MKHEADELTPPSQFARLCRVPLRTVRDLLAAGRLPHLKMPGGSAGKFRIPLRAGRAALIEAAKASAIDPGAGEAFRPQRRVRR